MGQTTTLSFHSPFILISSSLPLPQHFTSFVHLSTPPHSVPSVHLRHPQFDLIVPSLVAFIHLHPFVFFHPDFPSLPTPFLLAQLHCTAFISLWNLRDKKPSLEAAALSTLCIGSLKTRMCLYVSKNLLHVFIGQISLSASLSDSTVIYLKIGLIRIPLLLSICFSFVSSSTLHFPSLALSYLLSCLLTFKILHWLSFSLSPESQVKFIWLGKQAASETTKKKTNRCGSRLSLMST